MNGHASLNRSYTLVWNDVLQTYVVAPETARRKGKRSGAALQPLVQAAIVASAALGAAPGAWAQVKAATTVVPTGSNANAYIAPNGVPVLNISTANAAGISRNQFTRYDVEANGLVLNNGNTSQIARQSQLAGQVMANTNLVNEARIILNEVVSTSRSTLGGFTEVLGGKADVIVANPNGITCSGCGFINTDRVTLTTGTPNLAGDGSLTGFTVNRGDILINGAGLNASAQQILDLVARSVKVDGQINVPDLGIVAGANTWDYSSRNVSGNATASGTVPGYAIDSSALGGMYAGRIRLIATERSEERRVGKECRRLCRSRWSPYH
jgi:filamentous hemagglutinin